MPTQAVSGARKFFSATARSPSGIPITNTGPGNWKWRKPWKRRSR